MTLILGRKEGMTQVFAEDGTQIGVTVVAAGPCVVTQVRTEETDGYDAVQLGFADKREKCTKKPELGHFKKAGTAPKRFTREERLAKAAELAVGDSITCEVFAEGDLVDVIGTTKPESDEDEEDEEAEDTKAAEAAAASAPKLPSKAALAFKPRTIKRPAPKPKVAPKPPTSSTSSSSSSLAAAASAAAPAGAGAGGKASS